MEASIEQELLKKSLAVINSLATKIEDLKLANLAEFRFHKQAEASFLDLAILNDEVTSWMRLKVNGDLDYACYLSAQKIFNFINSFPQKPIKFRKLKTSDNHIQLIADDYSMNMLENTVDEKITVNKEQFPQKIVLRAKDLNRILDQVRFCIIDQKVRRSLMGMNLRLNQDQLLFIGSDSYRISICEQSAGKLSAEQASAGVDIIVSRRSLNTMQKIIGLLDPEDEVELMFDDRKLAIQTAFIYFKTLLVVDKYPDISRIYEQQHKFTLKVDQELFLTALRVFKNALDALAGSVEFIIYPDKTVLQFKADHGEMKKELPTSFDGPELKLAFNIQYLVEAVQSFDRAKQLFIGFNDQQGPVKITDPENNQYIHVLMPLAAHA